MFGKSILGNREQTYSWDFFQIYFKKFRNKIKVIQKNETKELFRFSSINKYDLIFTVNIISFVPVFLRKLGLIKVPVIHYWADDYSEWGFGGKWLRSIIENLIVKNADYNFTISRYREEKAKNLGVKKIKFFPQGVIKEFDKIKPSKKLEGQIKIVYGGEISKKKGIDKIMGLAEENKDVNIYLFGNMRKDINNALSDKPKNVYVSNQIPHKELISYYKASDILILATDNDSTLKMYEYIKAGKPILSLNNRVRYVMKHKETAYLTDDLSKGLRELIKNEKLRIKLSRNLKKYKIYNWEEVSEMYLDKMNKILKNKNEK